MPSCLPFIRTRAAAADSPVSTRSVPLRDRVLVSIAALTLVTLGAWLIHPATAASWDSDAQPGRYKALRRAPRAAAKADMPLKAGDLYALVVGVSQYADSSIHDLTYAAKDAKDFAAFLETQQQIFNKTHVTVLTDAQATERAIETFLYRDLPRAGKDDTIVLFFSGHGTGNPMSPGEFYFLPYDAKLDNLKATGVQLAGLGFLNNADSQRIVIVADACHAGLLSQMSTKSVQPALKTFMREFELSRGRAILTSSLPNQYSVDAIPGMPLKNSVFTHFLLKGLKGEADFNRDDIVDLYEAYNYAYRNTLATTGEQKPQFEGRFSGPFPLSVVGTQETPVKVDVSFVAQDPRCADRDCIDPPGGGVRCTDPDCGDVPIDDEATMYTGQNYQIGVRPHERSYVYVFQVDGNNQVYRLFPGKDYLAPESDMANPLAGGRLYWIPSQDSWLHHSDQEGKERIIVVASRSPNERLEDLYRDLVTQRETGGDAKQTRELNSQMQAVLHELMAPTMKSIRRKAKRTTGGGTMSDKLRSFEDLSVALSSSELDAATSVSFWVKKR